MQIKCFINKHKKINKQILASISTNTTHAGTLSGQERLKSLMGCENNVNALCSCEKRTRAAF